MDVFAILFGPDLDDVALTNHGPMCWQQPRWQKVLATGWKGVKAIGARNRGQLEGVENTFTASSSVGGCCKWAHSFG